MRHYKATLDNGHEFEEFEFDSEHKANSKANKEDCLRQYRNKHGRTAWNRYIRIREIYLFQ